jgi:acyl-CoA reductase-like NAD-dependent aldehyde dehydrogenase
MSENGTTPKPYEGFDQMPIAGKWREGRAGKSRNDANPYTGESLLEIPLADADDLDEAYRTAEEAQRGWAAMLPQERRDIIEGAARVLEQRKEEVIGWISREAGLPEGLLSIVIGFGSDIWDAFVEHPIPRVISFTGSTAVGQHIGELCGRHVEKASLELGGNGPLVILEDADLDLAVDAAINDEPNTAFGEEKMSGLGRFGGRWALDEFTTEHWVSVQHSPRTYPL